MSGTGASQVTTIAHDEVLTGEAVALDVQPAGLLMRILGAVIDMLISLGLIWLILSFAFGPLASALADVQTIVVVSTLVLVLVALPTLVETATRGRSVGKFAIGARIVRADGGAIGVRQAFVRAMVGVLEIFFTLGAIALLVGIFSPRSQRLGDLAAGTYAQRTRVPALPAALPPVPPHLLDWAGVADVSRLPDRLARRLAQFLHQVERLEPHARDRVAAELLRDATPFVAPLPPADPVSSLVAIAAVRRDREFTALQTESARVAALHSTLERNPHGFPTR